jgi:hypothetical protein
MNLTPLRFEPADYFRDEVRYGPGSFVVEGCRCGGLRAAILRKLVLVIATLRDGQAGSQLQ